MSFRDWEGDIEFFDVTPTGLVPRLEGAYREVQFSEFAVQDARVMYETERNQQVAIRVMGFTATNPLILASIKYPGGKEQFRRGELIGSQQPIEQLILPGLLRTRYYPVIKEFGKNHAKSLLPVPARRFKIAQPRKLH